MKKILLFLLLGLCSGVSAQTFDDAISRYMADSNFVVHTDSAGQQYVNIQPYQTTPSKKYYRLYYNKYDDSAGVAHVYFVLTGMANYKTGVSELIYMTDKVDITDFESNAYSGAHHFVWNAKFDYWYYSDQHEITITE